MEITESRIHYVIHEDASYTRHSSENWTIAMGESEELVYECSDIESEFQRAMENAKTGESNRTLCGVSHFWQHPKNFIMQKIREILKELNGQPTERTDKIVTWWIIFCCVALMIAAYCG